MEKYEDEKLTLLKKINELTYVQYDNYDVKKELRKLRAKLRKIN